MKKLITLFLFLNLYTVAFNQTLTGAVLDEETNMSIPYATVYINGTFTGTSCDKYGKFELDITKYNSMPITVSAVGYYSAVLNPTTFSDTENLSLFLTPKVFKLDETQVNAKSLVSKRRRYLNLFKEEFLGTTENAIQCEIMNEKDITFNYNSDKDTLKAYASRPIMIENKALGYKITYYLDKFEYNKLKEATFFCGNIKFTEDVSGGPTQNYFIDKRKAVYLGSRTHFFRALWQNALKSNGFTVTDPNYKYLKDKSLVIQNNEGNKFLSYPQMIRVSYKSDSYIYFLKKYVYFDKMGYFDPSGINWTGNMGNQRIADWLPLEYEIQ